MLIQKFVNYMLSKIARNMQKVNCERYVTFILQLYFIISISICIAISGAPVANNQLKQNKSTANKKARHFRLAL